MKKRHVVFGAVAAVLLIGGATATASDKPAPPPAPEWVNPDGSVDRSKMPDSFPVMGPDGKPLKDANGNTVRVDSLPFKPEGPPPAAPKSESGEKRWLEKDENGRTVEHIEIEPTIPAAD